MRTCCHCGAPSYGSNYCDPCDTDSCLVLGPDGDDYCRYWLANQEVEGD